MPRRASSTASRPVTRAASGLSNVTSGANGTSVELARPQRLEVSLDDFDRDVGRHVEFPRDPVRILERDVPPLQDGIERQPGRRHASRLEGRRDAFELGLPSARERDVIEADAERDRSDRRRASGRPDRARRRPWPPARATNNSDVSSTIGKPSVSAVERAGPREIGRAEREMVNAGRLQRNRHGASFE